MIKNLDLMQSVDSLLLVRILIYLGVFTLCPYLEFKKPMRLLVVHLLSSQTSYLPLISLITPSATFLISYSGCSQISRNNTACSKHFLPLHCIWFSNFQLKQQHRQRQLACANLRHLSFIRSDSNGNFSSEKLLFTAANCLSSILSLSLRLTHLYMRSNFVLSVQPEFFLGATATGPTSALDNCNQDLECFPCLLI